jgi:tetratricopeptide (TPR) repeat protein
LEGSPQELSRMQMDLGPAVLAVLRPGMKPSVDRPPDPGAFDLVLRARALRGYGLEDHFNRAVGLLNQAIQADPRYGGAYAELASAYAAAATNSFVDPLGAAEEAEAAAARAIQLDPSSATAYASEGYVDAMVLGKWKQGESEIRSALRLMPQEAAIHQRLGLVLLVQGEFEPALAEVRTAADLDPLVPAAGSSIGMVYFMERRYDRALAEWQKLAALHPDALSLRSLVGMAYEAKGEYAKAQAEYTAMAAQDQVGSDLRMMHLLAVCGQTQQARELVEKLAQTGPGGGLDFAATYAALGERDKAFEWLEHAWEKRSLWMLKVHPFLDPLRRDQRELRQPREGADQFPWLFEAHQVAGLRDQRQLGAGDCLLKLLSVHRGDQLIAFAPDQQGLGSNAVKALGQAALGNRKQDFAGCAQLTRVLHQETQQEFGIAQIHTGRERLGTGFFVIKEVFRQVVRHHGEDVGNGMGIQPEAGRSNEGQPRNIVRSDRGHFARDHSAHRESNQNRVFHAERLDYVPGVQGEIEHVAQIRALFAIAVARHERREDMKAGAESIQESEVGIHAASAVQEHQRPALSAFPISNRHPAGGNGFELHNSPYASTGGREPNSAGTARCGSG